MDFNIETTLRIAISTIGLISVLLRLFDSLSQTKRKKDLKLDFEIIEKINSNNVFESKKEQIKKHSEEVLDEYLSIKDTTIKWFDIFYASILFVGFGWWSVYLYEMNSCFTPWIILTSLFSVIGLSMLIDNKWGKKKKEKTLVRITLFDDVKYSIILLCISALIGVYIFLEIDGYTNWYILIGVTIPIGIKLLFDGIKIN